MKCLLVLSAIFALAVAYSEIDDTKDIEPVVTSPDGLKSIIDCFLDQGPCDEMSAAFRKVLPEITTTACANCSPAQKHMLRRFSEEARKHAPEDFKTMGKKYDPEGKYVDILLAAIADA